MRNQDDVLEAVLAKGKDKGTTAGSMGATSTKTGNNMRANRFVSVSDRLFEMADRATHDHCSFVLAVVLFHMVLRGLLLRVLYHRAALTIQTRYRYVKQRGQKANAIAPAMCIQRFWRGTNTALKIMRQDDAAWKIQRNYKAWKWNQRSALLLNSVIKIQRVWHSSVHRKWIKSCNKAATCVQRHARGLAVRLVLDKAGRELSIQSQQSMRALVARRSTMVESRWWSLTAIQAAKARIDMARHRQRNLDMRRMAGIGLRSDGARFLEKQRRLRFAGALQPARESVFEPMIFALARLDAPIEPRYGAKRSVVMQQVVVSRKALERSLPKTTTLRPHAAARRGREAVFVRRLVKNAKASKPSKEVNPEEETEGESEALVHQDGAEIEEGEFLQWLTRQYSVKQYV
jgi:hypothetical protein